MQDAQKIIRDSIQIMESFDPKTVKDVQAPVVSLYLPVHHTEREERRDLWDADMFKDLMKDAERTLAESYDERQYKGLIERMNYVLDHPDMPLWLHAGEGLGFLFYNEGAYVYNLYFAPEAMVVAGEHFFVKPLIRNFQYGTSYYLLELSDDRFSWAKGDQCHVEHVKLPASIKDYFSELYANTDDTQADMRKDEEGALDFITLEGHMSPYHDHESRKNVVKDEEIKWFRYVDKAVAEGLVKDDITPVILVTLPEHEPMFREVSTLRHLLPESIKKDPVSQDEEQLLAGATDIIEGMRKAVIAQAKDEFEADKAHGKASDDLNEIGLALVERKVKTLFVAKGKNVPGVFNDETGEIDLTLAPNPVDDGYIDPAAPDLADALAQVAMAQDAQIYVIDQSDMPTVQPVAAIYRY